MPRMTTDRRSLPLNLGPFRGDELPGFKDAAHVSRRRRAIIIPLGGVVHSGRLSWRPLSFGAHVPRGAAC